MKERKRRKRASGVVLLSSPSGPNPNLNGQKNGMGKEVKLMLVNRFGSFLILETNKEEFEREKNERNVAVRSFLTFAHSINYIGSVTIPKRMINIFELRMTLSSFSLSPPNSTHMTFNGGEIRIHDVFC